jgi:hypothetical protein
VVTAVTGYHRDNLNEKHILSGLLGGIDNFDNLSNLQPCSDGIILAALQYDERCYPEGRVGALL